MTSLLATRLFRELESLVLIDPHSHINPHAAASRTLADLLGYHYYTELAHSAGLPKIQIEDAGIDPKTKVGRLVEWLGRLDNTIQVSWLIELCREFFGFEDDAITPHNWEQLYDDSLRAMAQPDWETIVLKQSGLERVFLTNDFDDPLEGFDTTRYVPCLRTDDLVFHLTKPETRQRLMRAAKTDLDDLGSLVVSLGRLFEHFVRHNAKACAISLPPSFEPTSVSVISAEPVWRRLLDGEDLSADEQKTLSQFVFWTLAQHCAEFRLPFDLMIGVNRRVYEGGVYQGQDLFDQRVSLIQYKSLFNAFPEVTFPVSVLAQASNHELVSYSWIFPNVIAHGHWWYANTPAYIEGDCRARLQAVPRNKQIGYYSDMYKLEFGLPKFRTYRRVLAKVLAEDFVVGRGWSEENAVALGRQILRGNVESIFRL